MKSCPGRAIMLELAERDRVLIKTMDPAVGRIGFFDDADERTVEQREAWMLDDRTRGKG